MAWNTPQTLAGSSDYVTVLGGGFVEAKYVKGRVRSLAAKFNPLNDRNGATYSNTDGAGNLTETDAIRLGKLPKGALLITGGSIATGTPENAQIVDVEIALGLEAVDGSGTLDATGAKDITTAGATSTLRTCLSTNLSVIGTTVGFGKQFPVVESVVIDTVNPGDGLFSAYGTPLVKEFYVVALFSLADDLTVRTLLNTGTTLDGNITFGFHIPYIIQ